jgi:hypothetical protein
MDVKPQGIQTQQPRLKTVFEPWELRGATKRDCAPDRAGLLTGLAHFSTAAAWIFVTLFPILVFIPVIVLEHKKDRSNPANIGYGLLCLLPPLTAIGSAMLTRRLATQDLKRMWTGDMDRCGLEATWMAWSRSRSALWITLLGPVGWVAACALLYALFLVSMFGPKTLMRRGLSDLAPLARPAVGVLLYVLFLASIIGSRTLIRKWFSKATPNRLIP